MEIRWNSEVNILIINYEYPPIGAGAANASWNIAHQLHGLGCNVTVLTSCYRSLRGRTEEDGLTIYRVPNIRRYQDRSNIIEMASYTTMAILHLPGIIRRHTINACIVFFTLPCGPLGLTASIFLGVPYVISLRGGDVPGIVPELDGFHRFLSPLRRYILRRSKAVVANSKGLKEYSEHHDPIPVEIIPNGVDLDFFTPATRQHEIFRFLFVGRFQDQKNLFYLLENMDRLAHETETPFELHMVGDGPLCPALKDYSRSLNISNRITWHGWCSKTALRSLYQNCDCAINPSRYEGLPNVLLEAMACGLPVIASDVVGNNDLVRHEDTGILFNLSCPEDFIDAMRKVLTDRSTAVKLGKSARREIEHTYSWRRTAADYLKIFTDQPSDKALS